MVGNYTWYLVEVIRGEKAVDLTAIKTEDEKIAFAQWSHDEADLIERKKQALRKEKRELERERRKLEREKKEFSLSKRMEAKRMEKEKQLFEMKWKILEEELKKLADEKEQVEKQRKFYQYVTEHEKQEEAPAKIVSGDMFFVGVEDKQALKKRYKDLLKIYHPDNISGDVGTIQEINREYDRLQARYQ